MDWGVIAANLPLLMKGLALSFELAAITIVLSFPLGCLVAFARISHRPWVSFCAALFVNALRSNPLVLIIFWFYFLVPIIVGRPLGDLASTVIGFTVFFTAYFAEIVRSGIQSVGTAQVQAGLSTGLSQVATMRYIVLPQALRAMVPALTTECIIIFQATTVAYIVGYHEFLHTLNSVVERTQRPIELYLFGAAVYLGICYAGSLLSRRFEKKAAR